MKASTNFKGYNDTIIAIPCSNLYLQHVHESFSDGEGGLDSVEPQRLIGELLMIHLYFSW